MSLIDYSWDFTREDFSLDLDFFNEKEQEDRLWQARTGLNNETLCAAIEAIIFMSDRPISLQKIKSQIDNDLPLRAVHESIAKLQDSFEKKTHGIRLMEVAQGYQFRTKATYSKIIQEMFKVKSGQLGPTALEVLALVAYKQPVSKSKIESIRGVDSSHVIRQLIDKRLVKITGRSNEMGRPSLYGTTLEFLEIFNLANIDELPSEAELLELANSSDIASIDQIKTIVARNDSKKFDLDETQELDGLAASIKSISSDTMFTKSLKGLDKSRSTNDQGVKEEQLPRRSAFDILEDYINMNTVNEQNKLASASGLPMSFVEPKVVNLHSIDDHILNAPVETSTDYPEVLDELRELPRVEDQSENEDFDQSEIESFEADLELQNKNVENFLDENLHSVTLGEEDPKLEDPVNEEDGTDLTSSEGSASLDNDNSSEEEMLASELDIAFDNLFAEDSNLSLDKKEQESSVDSIQSDEDFFTKDFNEHSKNE